MMGDDTHDYSIFKGMKRKIIKNILYFTMMTFLVLLSQIFIVEYYESITV